MTARTRSALVFAALLVFGSPVPAVAGPAARGEDAAAGRAAQPQRPDFLFARPQGSIGLRGGWLFARAGSDLFDFVSDTLTIERSDFNAPMLAVDIGVPVTSAADVLIGFELSRTSVVSESRDFVDENGLPITQETRLRQMSVTASARLSLVPRGRAVSEFAWVPRPVVPYAGAGAGLIRYGFDQEGEFVDFVDLSIFDARLQSSGWTAGVHAFGGADVRLARRTYLTLEARYVWADAELDRDFAGFEPIDLSGLRLSAGFAYLF